MSIFYFGPFFQTSTKGGTIALFFEKFPFCENTISNVLAYNRPQYILNKHLSLLGEILPNFDIYKTGSLRSNSRLVLVYIRFGVVGFFW